MAVPPPLSPSNNVTGLDWVKKTDQSLAVEVRARACTGWALRLSVPYTSTFSPSTSSQLTVQNSMKSTPKCTVLMGIIPPPGQLVASCHLIAHHQLRLPTPHLLLTIALPKSNYALTLIFSAVVVFGLLLNLIGRARGRRVAAVGGVSVTTGGR